MDEYILLPESLLNILYSIAFISLILLLSIFIIKYILYIKKDSTYIKNGSKKKANGIIFGKKFNRYYYSDTNSEGHISVFGGSGLGKTSAILIPTLRNWHGTSFVIDISGDICKNVSVQNKIIYNPEDEKSSPYNIFGSIDKMKDVNMKNEALEELSFLLMPDSYKMSDASRFFNTEGRKILTASLISFYHEGYEFIEICEKIINSSWKNLFNDIDKTNNNKAIQYINSFEGASEQNTSGCKQSVDSVLKLFATNETIKKTIRRPKKGEVYFSPFKLEHNNIFIVIDDSKLKIYEPILHIITSQSLEYFSRRPSYRTSNILFCLDEFASLGKMEMIDALRKLRKKHIRIMVLTQSMVDIDLIYGRDERIAMMNNFKYKVILGIDDTDTQEYFSKLIGKKRVTHTTKTKNSNGTNYSESFSNDWVIEPSELARLKNNLIILYPGGHKVLNKNFYFKKH